MNHALALIIAAEIVSAAVLLRLFATAPFGFQDRAGFHLGSPAPTLQQAFDAVEGGGDPHALPRVFSPFHSAEVARGQ